VSQQLWLLKTEPENYSFDDLVRDGQTVWDGVSNAQALINIRAMRLGDQALIYHTGDERQIIGIAEITSEPYPDPQQNDVKLAVVSLKAVQRLPHPVTLAAIKAEPSFADFALVRQGRLSVVPVTLAQWAQLLRMAGQTEDV
jgi:predicted RNA-binding protein with PUA-like domain